MASRIGTGDAIARSVKSLEFARKGRFKKFGRLPVPPGANGREVRCACDACGAHLYAVPADDGRLQGSCVVCGGSDVTPV